MKRRFAAGSAPAFCSAAGARNGAAARWPDHAAPRRRADGRATVEQGRSCSPPTACGPTWWTSTPARARCPPIEDLMKTGVKGDNGLLQGFPPNTGVGWYTLATGTWPGEHGSTNNTFHRTGEANFNNSTQLRRDRHPAGRPRSPRPPSAPARRSSRSSGSARARSSRTAGPGRRLPQFFSDRGIAAQLRPARPAGRRQRLRRRLPAGRPRPTAAGWTNVPASFSPAEQQQFKLTTTAFPAATTPTASTTSTSTTRPTTARRTTTTCWSCRPTRRPRTAAAPRRPTSRQGDWADVKVTLDRRARRPDRRLLREGDRDRARPVASSASTSPRSRA